ncbi:hypothetical protein LF1_54480 [Rubripirellula obstinata]|uniref:Uncharacterized protein n=2 Tax=Rubripirellula obstinata TaxID=406547 RepID=A0A5B1CCA2_9BACT|nr:hypothetical protein LF1_54480 [Rubripirellula obstinata]
MVNLIRRLGYPDRYPTDVMKRISLLWISLLVALLPCCRSSLGRPDADWISDFDRTTTLTLESGDVTLELSDPSTIDRLSSIYANVSWQRYWHTLPGDVGDRSIRLTSGGDTLRTLCYTGILWESDAYDDVRTAELSDGDRDWVDSLFSRIDNAEPKVADNHDMHRSGGG